MEKFLWVPSWKTTATPWKNLYGADTLDRFATLSIKYEITECRSSLQQTCVEIFSCRETLHEYLLCKSSTYSSSISSSMSRSVFFGSSVSIATASSSGSWGSAVAMAARFFSTDSGMQGGLSCMTPRHVLCSKWTSMDRPHAQQYTTYDATTLGDCWRIIIIVVWSTLVEAAAWDNTVNPGFSMVCQTTCGHVSNVNISTMK